MSHNVKGCQMPALNRSHTGCRQNSEGRLRTSPEGGNRGINQGESGLMTVYGDLNAGSAFHLANQPVDLAIS